MEKIYPQFSDVFVQAIEALKGRKVVVIGHIRPDGDCIGSQVAMCRCLQALGIDAVAVNGHEVPLILKAFVKDTPMLTAAEFTGDGYTHTAVTVDCADHIRIGADLAGRFPKVFLNIDHHISNTLYAEHNLIHDASSATAEILAGLFFDNTLPLDPVIAEALYVGIATDTGQFRFGSTTKQVFEICCRLVDHGADPAVAALHLYEQESRAKLDLLQRFLASFEYDCDGRVCVGTLHPTDFAESGATKEDTEGLVDYTRSIEGVEIGVLLEEKDGGSVKGSFRAKDPVHRVDLLARDFNGGGHACAAGFNMKETLGDAKPKLVKALQSHFASLDA